MVEGGRVGARVEYNSDTRHTMGVHVGERCGCLECAAANVGVCYVTHMCIRLTKRREATCHAMPPNATPVPAASLGDPAELERQHVQQVYDAVAHQWHSTRYKAWPRVVDFVAALPPHSLIADLGCGNGKIAPHCRDAGHAVIGCDFSIELLHIARSQLGLEAQAADVMALPYRDESFDAALSIAVLHHVSTPERRRLLVAETMRVLRPGGRALFYAWAAEQSAGRSGHQFAAPDVFVPFHNRVDGPKATSGEAGRDAAPAVADLEALGGVFDSSKRAVVFQRYCHVYAAGELRELVTAVGGASILDEYEDTGNHCILVEKCEAPGG